MNPRQNFYSSVFEQISNYKKEREMNTNHNFLLDPVVGLGLFASVLVVGVFSGYLPVVPQLLQNSTTSASIIKTEERAAADVFAPDTSNAAENPQLINPSFVLVPVEDSYVGADAPQKSYGSEGTLKVGKNPQRTAFIKFRIPTDTVYSKVILRLTPKDSNDDGGIIAILNDNLWSERLLTFDSKPSAGEVRIGQIGPVSSRSNKEIDVTSYVQAGKTYTFKISTDGNESVDYASRESSSESSPALLFVK